MQFAQLILTPHTIGHLREMKNTLPFASNANTIPTAIVLQSLY